MTIGERERHYSNFHSSLSAESQLVLLCRLPWKCRRGEFGTTPRKLAFTPSHCLTTPPMPKERESLGTIRDDTVRVPVVIASASPSRPSSSTPLSFFFAGHRFVDYVVMAQCTYPYSYLATCSSEYWNMAQGRNLWAIFSLVPLREGKYPS